MPSQKSFARDFSAPSEPAEELESPFLDEELFADMTARGAAGWASPLSESQLKSPFQSAFESAPSPLYELDMDEFETEFYDLEHEADEDEFDDEDELDDEFYDEEEAFDEYELNEEFDEEAEAESIATDYDLYAGADWPDQALEQIAVEEADTLDEQYSLEFEDFLREAAVAEDIANFAQVAVERDTPPPDSCPPHPGKLSVVLWGKRIGPQGQRFLEYLRTQKGLKAAILARGRIRLPAARITWLLTYGQDIPETEWGKQVAGNLATLVPQVNVTVELFRILTDAWLDDIVLTQYLKLRHTNELPGCRYYLLSRDGIEGAAWIEKRLGVSLELLFKQTGIDPDSSAAQQRHLLLTYASFPSRIIESALTGVVQPKPSPKPAPSPPTKPADQPTPTDVEPTKPLQAPPLVLQEQVLSWKLPPKPWGPVVIGATFEVKLKGSAAYGAPLTKITFSIGEEKVAFETAVKTALGTDIKLKGEVKPGEFSKLAVGIGNESFEVKLEADANLLQVFGLKVKKPLYKDTGKRQFGDWVFEGTLEVSLELYLTANYAWSGWTRLIQTGKDLARAAVRGGRVALTVVRGLFIGGEIGTSTTLGVLAVGAGVAAAGTAWILFVLYKIGQAHREARARTVGDNFADGYRWEYSGLIGEGPSYNGADPKKVKEFYARLTLDWKREFKIGLDMYVEDKDRAGNSRAFEAGRAAMLQAMMQYYETFGNEAWQALRRFHRQKYDHKYYSAHLYRQIKNESAIFGIPPFIIER